MRRFVEYRLSLFEPVEVDRLIGAGKGNPGHRVVVVWIEFQDLPKQIDGLFGVLFLLDVMDERAPTHGQVFSV